MPWDIARCWVGQVSWNGVAVLARGSEINERHRALPGDADDDAHSRYLEAEVNGLIVACLYLPNGNPQPGPKFDYKLAWFERLIKHAKTLYASKQPVILAGDFNVVPTDFDIYDPTHWRKDALLQPESRACYERLLKQGWLDSTASQASRTRRSSRSGITSAITGNATRVCASIICCSTRPRAASTTTRMSIAGCAIRKARAITRRRG